MNASKQPIERSMECSVVKQLVLGHETLILVAHRLQCMEEGRSRSNGSDASLDLLCKTGSRVPDT